MPAINSSEEAWGHSGGAKPPHPPKLPFRRILLSLLPKLRDQFAEFLQHGSLNAFVFSTCSPVSVYSTVNINASKWNERRGFAPSPFFSGLLKFFELFPGKNIYDITQSNLSCIKFLFVTQKSYPSNPVFTIFLGAVWLCVDLRSAETFEHSAIMVFTWLYVTHVSILTSDLLKSSLENSFLKYRTFRYPTNILVVVVSVNHFSPDSSSAQQS